MFELVGYSCSYEPDEYNQNNGEAFKHESEEVVATFDNEKDALEYIKKSKLKKVVRQTWAGDNVFKKSSLLSYYQDAEVKEREVVPHNPKI